MAQGEQVFPLESSDQDTVDIIRSQGNRKALAVDTQDALLDILKSMLEEQRKTRIALELLIGQEIEL